MLSIFGNVSFQVCLAALSAVRPVSGSYGYMQPQQPMNYYTTAKPYYAPPSVYYTTAKPYYTTPAAGVV